MRHLNEPLVGHIPILFVCACRPGLEESVDGKKRTFRPYLFPKSSA